MVNENLQIINFIVSFIKLDSLDRLLVRINMNQFWQLQDAKNRFSEVVALALKEGPQLITRRGEKTAVVLSYEEYEKLCKVQGKLSEFFRESPLAEIDLERGQDLAVRGFQK